MKYESKAKLFIMTLLFVITCSHPVCSQAVNRGSSDRLHVISTISAYKHSIKHNADKQLILLENYITPLITRFIYATDSNFTRQVLYTDPAAYVRLIVAVALKKVQEDLATKGLGLKFFDAYRPYSVTTQMWKAVPDERYAANPAKGSGHNRGIAVDVTLVEMSTGEELAMPTAFDDFSEKAHHDYQDLAEDVKQNRSILKTTMEKYGFQALSTEWWHYSFVNTAISFELLDLSFKQLKKLQNPILKR